VKPGDEERDIVALGPLERKATTGLDAVVALVFSTAGSKRPGIELFAMLAGVVTTMVFLLLQARAHRRQAG
jgi:hypothetical protein